MREVIGAHDLWIAATALVHGLGVATGSASDPLTGIGFVALLVISFIVGGESPEADESTEEVVAFWTEEDCAQIASAIIGAWAAVFLVWFGATVAAAVQLR